MHSSHTGELHRTCVCSIFTMERHNSPQVCCVHREHSIKCGRFLLKVTSSRWTGKSCWWKYSWYDLEQNGTFCLCHFPKVHNINHEKTSNKSQLKDILKECLTRKLQKLKKINKRKIWEIAVKTKIALEKN
jgi:hypothetical protein